eukprot:6657173-Pyramimonas_sp.AAC.1
MSSPPLPTDTREGVGLWVNPALTRAISLLCSIPSCVTAPALRGTSSAQMATAPPRACVLPSAADAGDSTARR